MAWTEVTANGDGVEVAREGSEHPLNQLLAAYRFVFERQLQRDKEMLAALETWRPEIYKLIMDDIANSSPEWLKG